MRTAILVLLWCCIPAAWAEEALIEVEMVGVEATAYTMDCVGPAEDTADCIPWNNWYVYEGRVVDVLHGRFEGEEVRFALYAHSGFDLDVMNRLYVLVDRFEQAETAEKIGTPWYAREHYWPRQVVCLPQAYVAQQDDREDPALQHLQRDGMRCRWTGLFSNTERSGGCGDIEDALPRIACSAHEGRRVEHALAETEDRIRDRNRELYAREPWSQARDRAFAWFDRAAKAYRSDRDATCGFVATRVGVSGPAAIERREEEVACRERMNLERIRLLHRHSD